ncbi:hypothetical protein KTC96_14285 [Clostridium estertheticum]|uniref:hypothetical protein n=1 Tax=Clostridium estertheticum TaxID=238834 RepID=UPI002714B8F7|nr:hypothetical protein [Clostridium estertheticum]WLC69158.1 hypothetical protein KTC96_14285 [Clostridium estertheticum]
MDYLENKIVEDTKNFLKSIINEVEWTNFNWDRTFTNNGVLNSNNEIYNAIAGFKDEVTKI